MSKGRGRAAATTALVLCLVLLHYEVAQATVYNVGGASGWTFKMTSWPDAKRFKAGDVLGLYHSNVCWSLSLFLITTIYL